MKGLYYIVYLLPLWFRTHLATFSADLFKSGFVLWPLLIYTGEGTWPLINPSVILEKKKKKNPVQQCHCERFKMCHWTLLIHLSLCVSPALSLFLLPVLKVVKDRICLRALEKMIHQLADSKEQAEVLAATALQPLDVNADGTHARLAVSLSPFVFLRFNGFDVRYPALVSRFMTGRWKLGVKKEPRRVIACCISSLFFK